jgi:hypothetical protein
MCVPDIIWSQVMNKSKALGIPTKWFCYQCLADHITGQKHVKSGRNSRSTIPPASHLKKKQKQACEVRCNTSRAIKYYSACLRITHVKHIRSDRVLANRITKSWDLPLRRYWNNLQNHYWTITHWPLRHMFYILVNKILSGKETVVSSVIAKRSAEWAMNVFLVFIWDVKSAAWNLLHPFPTMILS